MIIYDTNHTNAQNILTDFNTIHPVLKFTVECETNNLINFRDVTIHRTLTNWRIAVYRKPTFTDTTIPYTSNHPTQHKYAAVRYLYNRLHTYNLQLDDYDTEATTIQNILYNNAFPIHHENPPNPKLSPDITRTQKKVTHTHPSTQEWATFTYVGKETTYITNLFKRTDIKIAFQTNNTIQKLLMHNQQTTDIHSRSGVYNLTCPDCRKAYVGQTGWSFAIRFQEHKMAFKTGNKPFNFAKHLMEHTHSFGPIHNTLQVLQLHNKGAHLNTIERFHIYSEYTDNNHLNDESTIFPNKTFDTLLKPHQP